MGAEKGLSLFSQGLILPLRADDCILSSTSLLVQFLYSVFRLLAHESVRIFEAKPSVIRLADANRAILQKCCPSR